MYASILNVMEYHSIRQGYYRRLVGVGIEIDDYGIPGAEGEQNSGSLSGTISKCTALGTAPDAGINRVQYPVQVISTLLRDQLPPFAVPNAEESIVVVSNGFIIRSSRLGILLKVARARLPRTSDLNRLHVLVQALLRQLLPPCY